MPSNTMEDAGSSNSTWFLWTLGESDPSAFVWIQVVFFLICLVVSAFFSGSETALTSMTKLRIKRLYSEGDTTYQKLEGWLHDPNRYLATILVGNNFVNILASVLSANITERLIRIFFQDVGHTVAISSALAVGVTTFLLLVFGEIVPKTYSKEHAASIAFRVVGPLDVMYKFLRPLIGIFLYISNTFIRLTGGAAVKEVPLLTEEDVLALIEMSEKEGLLEEEERDMIHSIFDFGDTMVKEIMTPRVDLLALSVETPFEEILKKVNEWGHSRIPIYEQELDHIVGILYVKDLLRVTHPDKFNLQTFTRTPLFIPKTKKVSDLLQTFKKEKNHMAIVVDEYGLTAGVVTIEDILEEIVGDIQDEYDVEEVGFEWQEDGSIVADAKLDLDILAEELDVEFPEEDVETLGGFISSLAGTVPKVNEEVVHDSLKFVILDSDERKINRVKVQRMKSLEEQASPLPDTPVENMNTSL
ncbi:MAG: hemolysin family protein [bacterium]